jgi:hypothetical protein
MPQNMAQAPTVQRAIMNRHHQARRSNSSIAPKLEPGAPLQSPQSRPTPSSHASSPTSNSPSFGNQGVMTPPASDTQIQFQQQHQQRLQAAKSQPQHGLLGTPGLIGSAGGIGAALKPQGPGTSGTGGTGGTPVSAAYYPSPSGAGGYLTHLEQLGKLSPPFLSLFFTWNYVRPRLIP